MFPILSTIPGIHTTIIGILAAFFSAFLIYAYQKVTESHKKLKKALKIAESASSLNTIVAGGKSSLVDENGDLDWEIKCKGLIHHAKSIYSDLDITKQTIDLEHLPIEARQEEIVTIVEELTPFFSLFFTKYPMNGVSTITNSQSGLKNKNDKFDYERYQEIEERIFYLMWVWNTSQQSLIHLFDTYDQINAQKNQNKMQVEINRINSDLDENPEIDEELRQKTIMDVRNRFTALTEVKRLPLLTDFFQKVQVYQTQVLPILNETIIEFESYNGELKVKETTKKVLKLIIYVMSTGIIIPLILLEIMSKIEDSHKYACVSYIEYLILLVSFLPYFYICFFFLRKIETTIFK